MKKIILGLIIVLGISFCAANIVEAIAYQELEIFPADESKENLFFGMSL